MADMFPLLLLGIPPVRDFGENNLESVKGIQGYKMNYNKNHRTPVSALQDRDEQKQNM